MDDDRGGAGPCGGGGGTSSTLYPAAMSGGSAPTASGCTSLASTGGMCNEDGADNVCDEDDSQEINIWSNSWSSDVVVWSKRDTAALSEERVRSCAIGAGA